MILYKTDEGVSQRKPQQSESYIKFSCPSNISFNEFKTCIKGLITDNQEMNFARNDVWFILEDLFKKQPRDMYHLPKPSKMYDCTILYVWAYLPFPKVYNIEHEPETKTIIPFDVAYISKKLTDATLQTIQGYLAEIDVHVYTRQLYEKPSLPVPIQVVGLKRFKTATDGDSSSQTDSFPASTKNETRANAPTNSSTKKHETEKLPQTYGGILSRLFT